MLSISRKLSSTLKIQQLSKQKIILRRLNYTALLTNKINQDCHERTQKLDLKEVLEAQTMSKIKTIYDFTYKALNPEINITSDDLKNKVVLIVNMDSN